MTDYHILMGGDEVALTRFFKDLHAGIYPLYFRGNVANPRGKLVRVDYNIAKPPVVALPESADPARFTLTFPETVFDLYTSPTEKRQVKLPLRALCKSRPLGKKKEQIGFVVEKLKSDRVSSEVLAGLLPKLNQVLAYFSLTGFEISKVKFGTPSMWVIKRKLLLAFPFLDQDPPTRPTKLSGIPKNEQFLAVSSEAIDSVVSHNIPSELMKSFDGFLGKITLTLGLTNPRILIKNARDIKFGLAFKLQAKSKILNVSTDGSFDLEGSVRIKKNLMSFTIDQILRIELKQLIPFYQEQILEYIRQMLNEKLRGQVIPLSELPSHQIQLNGLKTLVSSPMGKAVICIASGSKRLLGGRGSFALREGAKPPANIGKANIDHVVVAMFENRSFDNLVGWLYSEIGNQPPRNIPERPDPIYDGLDAKRDWNPLDEFGKEKVFVRKGAEDTEPNPDPNEQFRFMNRQIFGQLGTPKKPAAAHMQGFVLDYQSVCGDKDPKQIMHCFTPNQVPVLSSLAKSYAICDRWFASVPCQTWPNRGFVHAGTSCGRVNNLEGPEDDNTPPSPADYASARTIFNFLQDLGISWGIYSPAQGKQRTLLWYQFIHHLGAFEQNFMTFDTFEEQARKGTLPAYSFIEPRFMAEVDNGRNLPANDYHPPNSVSEGERFLKRIYQAVKQGKNWERTLLIVTFDEHGGCYDHVAPPWTAIRPDKSKPQKTLVGPFLFDRYGVRVPTLVISPYVEAGTVFRSASATTEYDHTSILRTLQEWVDPNGDQAQFRLTSRRIAAAPSLAEVLTRAKPRRDNPRIGNVPKAVVSDSSGQEAPNRIQRALVSAALEAKGHAPEVAQRTASMLSSVQDALGILARKGKRKN